MKNPTLWELFATDGNMVNAKSARFQVLKIDRAACQNLRRQRKGSTA
jgi:hypothetical protein